MPDAIDLGKLNLENLNPMQKQIISQALANSPLKVFEKGRHDFIVDGVQYSFVLNDILIKAESVSHPGETRYWVVDGDAFPIAEGGFGSILPVKGKITPLMKDIAYKQFANSVKVIKIQNEMDPVKESLLKKEVALGKQMPELNVKPTVLEGTRSYTVMNYISGHAMQDVIVMPNLTIEAWVNYFIKMSYQLQRIHDKGIIHRDLKPQNIMIDTTTEQLTIIDFGLSKIRGEKFYESSGSPGFAPPEVYAGEMSIETSDVYALGRTFEVILIHAPTLAKRYIPNELNILIDQMTRDNKYKRISIDEVIKQLENINFNLKYKTIPDNTDQKNNLLFANSMARIARKNLHDYSVKYTPSLDNKNIPANVTMLDEAFTSAIIKNLDRIKDDRKSIDEFIETLGIKLFLPLKGKDKDEVKKEMQSLIVNVTSAFLKNLNVLLDAREKLEVLASRVNDSHVKKMINMKLGELDVILDRQNQFGISMDEMVTLNAMYDKAIKKYDTLLINYNLEPEKLELLQLKNAIKYAVKTYFIKHELDGLVKQHGDAIKAIDAFELHKADILSNMHNDKRFSDRRKTDAKDILQIVDNATNSEDLVRDIEARLKLVKRGVFNTRFAKSEFVDNITEVMDSYKAFKHEEPEEKM